jgi:hypothetical protein
MSKVPTELTIGALSRQTGVNVETIRYYERERLLPSAPRTAGGHRVFGENHLSRLLFIRRSRDSVSRERRSERFWASWMADTLAVRCAT